MVILTGGVAFVVVANLLIEFIFSSLEEVLVHSFSLAIKREKKNFKITKKD